MTSDQAFGHVMIGVVNSIKPHDPVGAWDIFSLNTLQRLHEHLDENTCLKSTTLGIRIDSPKIGSPHGMRNELSCSKEVAPNRSLLHSWLRRGDSSRSSENLGRREAGFAGSRHRILALLIPSEGYGTALKKLLEVASCSFVTSSPNKRERQRH
jgi:hypothetical protein